MNEDISFKDANNFVRMDHIELSLTKFIWYLYIPSTKSLMIWKIMHNVIAIEDNMIQSGMHMISRCSRFNYDRS